jgi:LemA protein
MKTFGIVVGGLFILLLGGLGLAACAGVGVYNTMAKSKQEVEARWSQVENVYQRRADLIPNIVETVKGYMGHEHDTFTEIALARSKVGQVTLKVDQMTPENLQKFTELQNGLGGMLQKLMVQAQDRWPKLKADVGFNDLRAQLEGTENRIAVERRQFNIAVQGYNGQIVTFPNNLLAGYFGFKEMAYFKAEEGSNKAPKINFGKPEPKAEQK